MEMHFFFFKLRMTVKEEKIINFKVILDNLRNPRESHSLRIRKNYDVADI